MEVRQVALKIRVRASSHEIQGDGEAALRIRAALKKQGDWQAGFAPRSSSGTLAK